MPAERPAGTVVSVEVALLSLTAGRAGLVAVVVDRDDRRGPSEALPGAPLAAEESLERAALRILAEQAGVPRPRHLEQLASFGDPGRTRGARAVSVTYLALQPEPTPTPARARWVAAAAPPPLADDHGRIVAEAVQRVRAKLSYSNIAYGLLPPTFTLSELQEVYEGVLGTTLDKRNFRRKVLGLGLLTETGQLRRGSHRPAQLYRFAAEDLVVLDDIIAT